MGHPELVRDCLGEMQNGVSIPITVKHRIGIDDQDDYAQLHRFVEIVAQSGTKTFIVHARKAILDGLSPKENREIPPLIYDMVYQLKKDFPTLEIIINGGIKSQDDITTHLSHVDGVMLGREAYQNPWILAHVDHAYFGSASCEKSREDILRDFVPYLESELTNGTYLGHMTRHILGLFHAQPGGKKFRRHLSENSHKKGASIQVIKDALAIMGSTNRF